MFLHFMSYEPPHGHNYDPIVQGKCAVTCCSTMLGCYTRMNQQLEHNTMGSDLRGPKP